MVLLQKSGLFPRPRRLYVGGAMVLLQKSGRFPRPRRLYVGGAMVLLQKSGRFPRPLRLYAGGAMVEDDGISICISGHLLRLSSGVSLFCPKDNHRSTDMKSVGA